MSSTKLVLLALCLAIITPTWASDLDGTQIDAILAASANIGSSGLQDMVRQASMAEATTPYSDHADQWNALSSESKRDDIEGAFGDPDLKIQQFDEKSEVYEYYYTNSVVGRVLILEDGAVADKKVSGL